MEPEDPSRPGFLELLDRDPNAIFQEFYIRATIVLSRVPPTPMRILISKGFGSSQDLLHDFVLHCVEKNFKVVRGYVPRKRPFEAWLYVVARNYFIDVIRKYKRELESECVSIEKKKENGVSLENIISGHVDCDDRAYEFREIISVVKRAISAMDDRCRLLLELAADGYEPRDIVTILCLPRSQNKKISDDLGYCRKKQVDLLRREGIDISLYVKKRKRNRKQGDADNSEKT